MVEDAVHATPGATPADGRPRPLHVLVLGLNYAPETTGIAPYTTGVARHLAAQGHQVTVLAGHPHYPEWALHPGYEEPRPPEEDHGVRLVRVPHPVPTNPSGLSRVWMEAVFAWNAGRRLLRERPDVVVVVSPALLALGPAVLLRRVRHFRLGVVVQDLYGAALSETGIGGGRVARLTARLESWLLRRTDGVVVIHEVFRQRLLAEGVPTERLEVVPNWSHVSFPGNSDRDATRRRLGWGADEVIALHAGNMGAKQGLEGLIDVARLADQHGSKVRVVLMGNGSRRSALEDAAAGSSRLTIVDSLPAGEFESALVAADCLLLHEKPGVVEMSVPSKLTTYFSAGRPVVAATDPRSGAAALMQAAQAGLVVRAGDAEGILRAVQQLADDPEGARTLGENGRRYAAEHLTAAASLRRQEAWVRRLAG